jgi:hypothetical protein
LLVPAPPPLTYNQMRALRFSQYALDEKLRRGDPDPGVIVSSPAGEWLVRPGGRLIGPAPVAAAPAVRPAPANGKVDAVHASWRTPTPRELADLIRGR